MSGGRVAAWLRRHAVVPAGVQEHGIDTAGSLGTWEASVVSISTTLGVGGAKPKLPGPRPASGRGEKRRQAHGMVPPSEGNEVRRKERWGFGASHSTEEAGELASREPCGGKGAPSYGTVGGKH